MAASGTSGVGRSQEAASARRNRRRARPGGGVGGHGREAASGARPGAASGAGREAASGARPREAASGDQGDASRHTFSSLALKELNHRSLKDKSTSPDSMPMKELIAVAQARRFSRSTSFPDNFLNAKYVPETSVNTPPKKKLAGQDEANAARRSFRDFLSTLTRTKESIARATRLAIECAKCGIAGGAGDVYPSLIQAVLPRILYAAAPPGNSAWENRKQCLKVLKLWLERKTLSEYVIRHHIREIETINEASFGSSRRPSRTERALNDPLRDNEGMLVDEYGSNAGFQLPNLICTKVLEEEEGSSSEDKSFEAVTPEQDAPSNDGNEESQMPAEKHHHILEEVDGELEMEDVAPPSDVDAAAKCQPGQTDTNCTSSDQRPSDGGPPLPVDRPPSPPPLPSSPPPVPPPPPAPIPQRAQMPPKLQMASDPIGSHPSRATYNVQSQQPHSIAEHPGNMNPSVAPLPPPPFNNSGYGAQPNQIPPPPPMAPLNPPGPHGSFPAPQHPTMEITIIDLQLHQCLMRDIICNHHPLHRLQINSLLCHPNTNKGHLTGVITVHRILRDIVTMDMIEVIKDMIEGIMGMTDIIILMIEDITMMIEAITMMIEAITMMIEDIILMTEDITLTRDLLGGQCTMTLLTGEDILILQDLLQFQTILKLHQVQCTMDDHQILHQGLVQAGLGPLGYLTILPPEILSSLQFHMQLEVLIYGRLTWETEVSTRPMETPLKFSQESGSWYLPLLYICIPGLH
ncbi:hypothetical protein U9M48_007452 [Paspalum notatum var. saurae]|uniref:CID domain-containing protein n=1 Tax=Paspalum notatum var. saurae TaxID=547442 RepID=A0AAQ3Q1Q5_PASNO